MFETQRLLIRELKKSDAVVLSKYRSKEEVAYYQSWNHYPLIKAQKRIEYCLKHPLTNKRGNYQLAIVLKATNQLIGDLYIEVLDEKYFSLGYTLDSDYWSLGYASEALKGILDFMKDEYGFKLVLCHVYSNNTRSIRLLENNGFEKYERSLIMGDIGYKKLLGR